MALSAPTQLGHFRVASDVTVSGSVNPGVDDCLLIAVVNQGLDATVSVTSLSGGGLTWTRDATVSDSGGGATIRAEIWSALVTTNPGSFTLTASFTFTGSPSAGGMDLQVFRYTGHDTTDPIGATASGSLATNGSSSITLNATPAVTSSILSARASESDDTVFLSATPGTGWTELYDESLSINAGYSNTQTQYRAPGSTSTTVLWNDTTVGAANVYSNLCNGVAVEIKEASGGTDALTADNLTAGTPTLTSAALGQVHALTASGLTAGTPTLTQAALGQVHALSADNITAGTPTLTSPALTEVVALDGDDLTVGTPTLTSPALGQIHDLSADDLTTGTPTLTSPALGQVHALTGNDITAGTPTLTQPALGVEQIAPPQPPQTGGAMASSGRWVRIDRDYEIHDLRANNIVVRRPVLGRPVLQENIVHRLTGNNIVVSRPILSKPKLMVDDLNEVLALLDMMDAA